MAMHVPVMLKETMDFLNVRRDGIYIDATVGDGGHAEAILGVLTSGKLLGIDCDPSMAARARERLASFGENVMIREGNFAAIQALHAGSGFPPADGMLADLGISSVQLEDASRGLSFERSGLLDMRLDPQNPETAAAIVNQSREHELADLIFRLGEERYSRRIARAIVKARPIQTTTSLAQVVQRAIPSRAGLHQLHLHPATRTFLALRLAVNQELENLGRFLAQAVSVLAPRGRLVILSFHSLEDRMVKQAFRSWQRDGAVQILTRKVVRPSADEVRRNPRSRSAKLRAAEKIAA
jgi:16S rRNA (cytosine1402-N4)-methyltransferase